MLYRSTDRLCRSGAPMENLCHSASFESDEKNAPSKSGTKHLADARWFSLTPRLISFVFQTLWAAARRSLVIPLNREMTMSDFNRRDALKMSASLALAAAAGGFSCVEMAKAGPIEVPPIDKLSVRVLVDGASDIFFRPQEAGGVRTEPGRSANLLRPLHSEWGLSLLLEPQRGDEKRTFLLDYGWTPEAINGNMDLLKVDASKIDTLILS